MFGYAGQKDREIQRLTRLLQEVRAKASERRARESGEERGIILVAEQLAKDIRLGTIREEQHRKNAAQMHGDLQRALRIVAAHILDVRDTAETHETATACELLRDRFEAGGISLRGAFIAVQTERADAAAKVSGAEAAAAIAAAPVPVGR